MNVLEVVALATGWVVTGAALFYGDRFLDRHIGGTGQKVVTAIPFWWFFIWAAAAGGVTGTAKSLGDLSATRAAFLALFCLLLIAASIWSFRLRFGLTRRER